MLKMILAQNGSVVVSNERPRGVYRRESRVYLRSREVGVALLGEYPDAQQAKAVCLALLEFLRDDLRTRFLAP
jgi:hypothetical protein